MKGFIEVVIISESGFTDTVIVHYTQLYYKYHYWWFKKCKIKQSNKQIKQLIKEAE